MGDGDEGVTITPSLGDRRMKGRRDSIRWQPCESPARAIAATNRRNGFMVGFSSLPEDWSRGLTAAAGRTRLPLPNRLGHGHGSVIPLTVAGNGPIRHRRPQLPFDGAGGVAVPDLSLGFVGVAPAPDPSLGLVAAGPGAGEGVGGGSGPPEQP
jgi:hypothetical protein